MVQEWLVNGVFLYLMAGVCGAAIFFKLLLTSYYNRQLRQTLNMDAAKKKWLLKMRQEYETCVDMHGKVNNVDIFVDKYVEGKKYMGIMLSTWDKIGGQAWILCAGLLVVAAVSGIFYQVDREVILFTFFVGIWTVIVDIVVDNIANLVEKRNQLKRNLTDYFDNHAWDGAELTVQERKGGREDFSQEEAFWNNEAFSEKEAEDDFEKKVAFSGENNTGQEGSVQEEETSKADGYPGAIRIRHLLKQDNAATQQNVDFEEWKRKMEADENSASSGNPPKFYVVSGTERGKVRHEPEHTKNEVGAKKAEEETSEPTKKVRRESKKEVAARKKREHMKYELKREITHKDAQKDENPAQEDSVQHEKKTASKEAVEQLAAALDLLKKENALEEAAPLLAAQISRDQENGALIEEVLREFLI